MMFISIEGVKGVEFIKKLHRLCRSERYKERGRIMDKVYEKTIRDTIELLQLVIDASDKTITVQQRQKAIKVKKEYEKRLEDWQKKEV